eukprot:CAMPEP_0119306602 /NCGR_PEP_ID=MMETSP1333-20130426/7315_1 /TAXON_ID=418940 /ORGANISM="Scyphosphaera apsteinii, Strain RCC1455" /LENGTH=703 /DNA_ID=CAMNT_0007309939 /DNA_START=95 /DNA_END=2206 /DNA_ORIENTATION=+
MLGLALHAFAFAVSLSDRCHQRPAACICRCSELRSSVDSSERTSNNVGDSVDNAFGVVKPVNRFLVAPGVEYKKAVYNTKPDDPTTQPLNNKPPEEKEAEWELLNGVPMSVPYVCEDLPLDQYLQEVIAATQACVCNPDPDAQEAYGDWCRDKHREALIESLSGLRGKKLAWWLDAPRPLRAVVGHGSKYEVSVVCMPAGSALPPAAFPRGSVLLCQPLLGIFTVRRLRFDITGKSEKPIELMKRSLRFGDKPLILSGGSCHEFTGGTGTSAAFLQVAMLPPASVLPSMVGRGDASIGWRRPPGESCEDNADVISGVTLGVEAPHELLLIDRPTAESLARERDMDRATTPANTSKLADMIGQRVGGLDGVVDAIVRRVLASRLYPPALMRPLGIQPVRGLLLFGPPGCGKTLLAREIAQAMGAREPKIVNGPEMMSKYVGESEEYIRALFADAEVEQAEAGEESLLHVIVFDEMDAFTRERGKLTGDTSGIRDSVVNQLLAKLDGVDQLDNVLVIGITNRPQLMDPALLRPGRLEAHVEVPRPDLAGRQRITAIHSRRLRERDSLDSRAVACLTSGALAHATEGFSGADIAALFRAASSYALERYVDESMLPATSAGKQPRRVLSQARRARLEVRFDDFLRALSEVRPSGSASTRIELGSGGLGLAARVMSSLRSWRRKSQFRKLTDRAMARDGLQAGTGTIG